MPQRDLYLAAYDVADPRRLRRTLRHVRNFSRGGQKSAYECYLGGGEQDELLDGIPALIEVDEDRFYLLPVTQHRAVRVLGKGVAPDDGALIIVR